MSRVTAEDQLLRNLTFLANVSCAATRLGLANFHEEDMTENGDSLKSQIIVNNQSILRESRWLMENHKNSDIKMQARKIHVALESNTA